MALVVAGGVHALLLQNVILPDDQPKARVERLQLRTSIIRFPARAIFVLLLSRKMPIGERGRELGQLRVLLEV